MNRRDFIKLALSSSAIAVMPKAFALSPLNQNQVEISNPVAVPVYIRAQVENECEYSLDQAYELGRKHAIFQEMRKACLVHQKTAECV